MKLIWGKPKYYVEVCRFWEHHSYDTRINMMSYAHPIFLIKERKWFGRERVVKTLFFTSRIEDALDEVRKLNGQDYIPNEIAYNTPDLFVKPLNPTNSGIYVRKTDEPIA